MNYFTGPKGKAAPKPPPKPPKKAAIESQPIPTTLVAARSIGSHGATTSTLPKKPNVSQSDPLSTSPSVLMPARNPPSAQPPATSPGVSSIPPKSAVPSSDTISSLPPPALSEPTTGSAPKPAQNPRPPQPVNRPKQPPSIFIPKKVRLTRTPMTTLNPFVFFSQRPAPGSGSGGPNKKRA